MKILAGIITYNPDLSRLDENVKSVMTQVDGVVIVDNCSENIGQILDLLEIFKSVVIIQNKENLGVAKALNQEAEYGIRFGYDWLLSLDQDSVSPPNMMEEYKRYILDGSVGMITCKIVDRNFGELDYMSGYKEDAEDVESCITSGSMLRLNLWKQVKGYNESLFIDSVDFDLCYTLREAGWRIVRVNKIILLHEVGKSKKVHVLGKDRQLVNHTPIRYYYIYRNGLYVAKKHHKFVQYFRHLTFNWFLINKYESNRKEKNIMIARGIWHYIIGRYGKYE